MNFLNRLSNLNKLAIIIATSLIVYGYLCRIFGVHFFWESRFLGWSLLIFSLIPVIINRIRFKRQQLKKVLFEKIIVIILIFILLLEIALGIILPNTDAYKVAKDFIFTNESIKSQIGVVKKVTVLPYGAISVSSDELGQSGDAELNFIIKGQNKFIDATIYVKKEINSEWQVIKAE